MAEFESGAPIEQVSLPEQLVSSASLDSSEVAQPHAQQQQRSSGPSQWTTCSISQGFYVTSDLSKEELEGVLRSEEKDKWDKYLCHDNIKRMKIMSFSDCHLRKIPMTLCQITSVVRLYFSMNKLDSIPTEFAQLENLTNLSLASNQFVRIPEAIGRLRNLKILSMQRNRLTNEGLDTLKQNVQLEELSLASNQLSEELPHSVCQLKSLTLLDLRNNRIESLTEDIANLTELRVLNVRQNHLYTLPRSIGKLTRLKLACFAENCISHVSLQEASRPERSVSLFKPSGGQTPVGEISGFVQEERQASSTCRKPSQSVKRNNDVTFIHDGTDAVASWVQRAKRHLETGNISSTVKTPQNKSIDIVRAIRTCHVIIPVFTKRFHEMVDRQDPSGSNLRDALDGFVKTGQRGSFLLVFFEPCGLSSRWFIYESRVYVQGHLVDDGSNGDSQTDVLDELCSLVKNMKGDRVRMSSTCMPHS